MKRVVLTVKNAAKLHLLVNFLREIHFVSELHERENFY